MMLVDANILIDVALDRHPHSQYAVALLNRLAQESGLGCVAWHTIATFYYIVASARQERMARDFIAAATDFLRVAPTGDYAVRYALSLPMADFEDAMQVSAARAAGAGYIITRNLRDFANSPIQAITPQQALETLF